MTTNTYMTSMNMTYNNMYMYMYNMYNNNEQPVCRSRHVSHQKGLQQEGRCKANATQI